MPTICAVIDHMFENGDFFDFFFTNLNIKVNEKKNTEMLFVMSF